LNALKVTPFPLFSLRQLPEFLAFEHVVSFPESFSVCFYSGLVLAFTFFTHDPNSPLLSVFNATPSHLLYGACPENAAICHPLRPSLSFTLTTLRGPCRSIIAAVRSFPALLSSSQFWPSDRLLPFLNRSCPCYLQIFSAFVGSLSLECPSPLRFYL